MKIIIDIPDKVMNSKEFCNYFGAWSVKLDEVIENGVVLPKGHGKLYDEKVLHSYWGEKYDLPIIPYVIDADKENDDESLDGQI